MFVAPASNGDRNPNGLSRGEPPTPTPPMGCMPTVAGEEQSTADCQPPLSISSDFIGAALKDGGAASSPRAPSTLFVHRVSTPFACTHSHAQHLDFVVQRSGGKEGRGEEGRRTCKSSAYRSSPLQPEESSL